MPPAILVPAVVAVLAGAGLLVLALQVDDWRRDLTTNVAETDPEAEDPLLRPLELRRSVEETAVLIEHAAAGLSRWDVLDVAVDSAEAELHLVRTSRLFRFRDDVTVWVEGRGGGCAIRARSASRVGRGDLGQNPRNLRVLMRAIRDAAGEADPL